MIDATRELMADAPSYSAVRAMLSAVTALGAGAAWFLGMLPSTTYPLWRDWPWAVLVPLGLVMGLALVPSMSVVGGLLAAIHERLLELPIVAYGVAWVILGYAIHRSEENS